MCIRDSTHTTHTHTHTHTHTNTHTHTHIHTHIKGSILTSSGIEIGTALTSVSIVRF